LVWSGREVGERSGEGGKGGGGGACCPAALMVVSPMPPPPNTHLQAVAKVELVIALADHGVGVGAGAVLECAEPVHVRDFHLHSERRGSGAYDPKAL